MSDCWLLKKRREKELANLTGVQIPISSIGLDKSEIIREEFKPFVCV